MAAQAAANNMRLMVTWIAPPRFVAFVLLLAQVSNSPRGEARTATLTRQQYMHFFE